MINPKAVKTKQPKNKAILGRNSTLIDKIKGTDNMNIPNHHGSKFLLILSVPSIFYLLVNWCPRWDSNPHVTRTTDFESVAATDYATRANSRLIWNIDPGSTYKPRTMRGIGFEPTSALRPSTHISCSYYVLSESNALHSRFSQLPLSLLLANAFAQFRLVDLSLFWQG